MGLSIIWASNSIQCRSGYGIQGHYVVPGMQHLGNRVAVFAWWGLQGGIAEIDGITTYPAFGEPYGNDVARQHADHWDADLVISLVDLWVCAGYADTLPQRWMPYFPIDSVPIPPEIYNLAKRTQWPVTYSQWGVNELAKVGVNAYYVPHGVGDAYRPNPEAGKRWRAENGIPQDAYMVASVYANKGNPSRKNFDGCFRAFAEFSKTHPDAIYYMHSEPSVRYQGVDLWRLIRELGIAGKVIIPNSYLLVLGFDETWMAGMYNAADVLLSATKGEGLGIPVIEAQACGVPVIVTNYSALPELVDHPGPSYKVRVAEWEICPLHSRFAIPDTEDITKGLETAYSEWRGGKPFTELSTWAEQYYWENVITNGWGPMLAKVEHDLNRMPWKVNEHPVLSTAIAGGQ